jgi:hypothetical protein
LHQVLECVEVKEDTEPEVCVAFSPRFEQIWFESRKRLPQYMEQKPANAALRSQYSLRALQLGKEVRRGRSQKNFAEEFQRVFGLESAPGIFARKYKITPFRE